MTPELRLLPPVAPWQDWPDDREPTEAELESLTEDEYDCFADRMARTVHRHPSTPPSAKLEVIT
jgi:hypothetical protein